MMDGTTHIEAAGWLTAFSRRIQPYARLGEKANTTTTRKGFWSCRRSYLWEYYELFNSRTAGLHRAADRWSPELVPKELSVKDNCLALSGWWRSPQPAAHHFKAYIRSDVSDRVPAHAKALRGTENEAEGGINYLFKNYLKFITACLAA
jgi:hypothetical protein